MWQTQIVLIRTCSLIFKACHLCQMLLISFNLNLFYEPLSITTQAFKVKQYDAAATVRFPQTYTSCHSALQYTVHYNKPSSTVKLLY